MIKRYRFCAPPGHTYLHGPKTYVGGDEFDLEESQAADDRLVMVDDYAEAVDIWPADAPKSKGKKDKITTDAGEVVGVGEVVEVHDVKDNPAVEPQRSPLYPKEDRK